MNVCCSTVREYGGSAALVAAEAREGTWGAAPRHNHLAIEWPGDNTTLRAGDRSLLIRRTYLCFLLTIWLSHSDINNFDNENIMSR